MSKFYTAASQKDPLMEWPWVQGPQRVLRRGDRGTEESLRQIQQDRARHRLGVSTSRWLSGSEALSSLGTFSDCEGGNGSGSASNSVPQFLYL